MTHHDTILVTGATGNVGRHLVRELHGRANVRALVRDPDNAALPDHAELVRGDLTDPATVAHAAKGVDAVFLLWPLMTPHQLTDILDALTDVRRIVYLSSEGIRDETQQPDPITQSHADVERHIQQRWTQWTFLRPVGFATNILGWAEDIATHHTVRDPFPDLARPLIHEGDIATAAAHVLTEDGHSGKHYVLTGPEHLTSTQQVPAISAARGITLHHDRLTPAQARQEMVDAGWPTDTVDGILAAHENMRHHPEPVTTTVQDLTGTPARTFARWALDHVRDFGGNPADLPTVAHAYVEMCRAGDFAGAIEQFFPDDHVRVENSEELHGLAAVLERSQNFGDDNEIHGFDVQGPFVGGNHFAVRFAIDTTLHGGSRRWITKACLYTVDTGRIVREEVYYDAPEPQ